MKDEDLQKRLQEAPLPEPAGGLEAARERAMGRVRHKFPADAPRETGPRSLWRPLGATALAGTLALLVFLAWPEPRAEADPLPTETHSRLRGRLLLARLPNAWTVAEDQRPLLDCEAGAEPALSVASIHPPPSTRSPA